MATPNRGSFEVDRRASVRNSMPLSREDDIQEDLYDLEAAGISDGFRPPNVSSGHSRMTSRTSQHTVRRLTPPPRPSSATKPSNIDTFALRHDGPMVTAPIVPVATSSSTASTITRNSIISTDTPFMRAESPYTGPAGPSHPYQMYPQDTRVARTASIATTSTVHPASERSYTGPTGPTHPYQMYPQDTVAVPEGEEMINGPIVNANIPLGFPGLHAGTQYQRRFGPDGEDAADLIGPNGHTEQLPPYSQYPDEAFARKAGLPGMEGAGGLGLATRNPEFESRDDLRSPQSRQSTQSALSQVTSHQVNAAAAEMSEKPSEPRWKTIARKKICGLIPVWVIVLVAAVIILFVVILGSVLGVLLPRHSSVQKITVKPKPSAPTSGDQYITVTTTYDAKPMPTLPPGLPDLPLGTFALPYVSPASTSSTCISNQQSSSWQCAMTNSGNMVVTISNISGNSNTSCYALTFGMNNSLSTFSYGTQPPIFNTPQTLRLVEDSDDSGMGPAWFFQAPYDKWVILPQSALSAPSKKRDIDIPLIEPRAFVAQPGDKPWFCFWNNTLLETFIYINETSMAGAQQASASASRATATAASIPSSSPTQALYVRGYSTSAYSTSASSSSAYSTSAPRTSTASSSAYAASPSSLSNIQALLPTMYPKIVKIEERRVPQSPQPYCIQMVISSDGMRASPYVTSQGQQTVIYINETESGKSSSSKRDLDSRQAVPVELVERQSSSISNSCSCEWRIT